MGWRYYRFSNLFLLCISLALVRAGEFDFTVEIPAGKFQCYFQPVSDEKHKTMEIDYQVGRRMSAQKLLQVIDGGDLNINFMVLLGADMLIQEKMKTDGSHKIELKTMGDYQVCFDNSFSYQARKVVFFEIFLFDANGNLDEMDLAKLSGGDAKQRAEELGVTLAVFHESAQRIKSQLNKIEYHQALMRAYEARDRAIMNANFDRVTFWSILNALVLIGVGGLQVFLIRSLFEENSKTGRFLRKGGKSS